MLRDLTLKAVYRSEDDNLLEDFYVASLKESVAYDRAVGFFSAAMFSYAAQGLSAFVQNEGRMRLIFGGELDEEDAKLLVEGYELRAVAERLGDSIVKAIDLINDPLFFHRLEAVSWLIASGRLQIKVALKRRGMYHEKIGVFTDANADKVVFQGSANETAYALLPDFNFESINVFPSWRPELQDHIAPHVNGFEQLWNDEARHARVIDFPEAAREQLLKIAKRVHLPRPEIEIDLVRKSQGKTGEVAEAAGLSAPHVPLTFGGREFQVLPHQRDALQRWRANDLQGILALATGAGKTVTAIYGAVRVFESARRLFMIVAVPYQSLADQWVEVLREFNIVAIECYGSAANWTDTLSQCVTLFQTRAMSFVCAVVVNRTLQSPGFQQILAQMPGDQMLFIGDECHHHAAAGSLASLPEQARFRLGLSATPEDYMNDDATNRLTRYYGSVVARYELADALRDEVLTPYRYHVEVVDLTVPEAEEYRALSDQIARLAAQRGHGDIEGSDDEQVKMLLFRRARLLGAASNKIPALERLLHGKRPQPLTLFYCGDGRVDDEGSDEPVRQIEAVSQLIGAIGWRNAHFTSRETRRERQEILDFFRLGIIDAMVAIRCLDEGIDVPACRTAYILASSRNPKQFIQRRGRILRRSAGKDRAEIYDFIVQIPDDVVEGAPFERHLMKNEIRRVAEFARLSDNVGEVITKLAPVLDKYDLQHYLV